MLINIKKAKKKSDQIWFGFFFCAKPAIDSKTGVYKVNGDYYADLADEDIDGM